MTARARILPMPEPIALRRIQAAAYVGLSAGHFDKAVESGLFPHPVDLAGVKVWTRRALEQALDPNAGAVVNTFSGVQ